MAGDPLSFVRPMGAAGFSPPPLPSPAPAPLPGPSLTTPIPAPPMGLDTSAPVGISTNFPTPRQAPVFRTGRFSKLSSPRLALKKLPSLRIKRQGHTF